MDSEKYLESRLVEEIKKRGGMALKYTSQFHRGIPDRIVLLPYRTIAFVELKTTGKKPNLLQEAAMSKLMKLGYKCFVVDSSDMLDYFLSIMDQRLHRIEACIRSHQER